jgi:small neutral amino acid transporter SnatA (MarC family)
VAYAREQAGYFGAQVRWVSQRFGPWGALARSSRVPRGGGYGVVGEALTGLWRVAQAEPRLADLRAPLAERATCIAGLAAQQQIDATEATAFPRSSRVRGTWVRDGETRMDDQQHAVSALLRTIAIVEHAGADGARAADGTAAPAPAAWLWAAALVAALNPFRAALGVPRRDRAGRPSAAAIAALGGAAGAGGTLAVALAGDRLLDLLDVSDPAARIAAGAVAAIVGGADLVRRPPSPEPALAGWRAALVPVAVPLVLRPALVLAGVSAHADRGIGVVVAALAVAVTALSAAATAPTAGASGRAMRWGARLTAAVLVATSVLLVVDGVLDV